MFETQPKLIFTMGAPITAADFADDGWGPEFAGPTSAVGKRYVLDDGTHCSIEMRSDKMHLRRIWEMGGDKRVRPNH